LSALDAAPETGSDLSRSDDRAIEAWCSPDQSSRIYQGDSLELLATLPENSVDCVWTDPPYLLSNDGTTCVAGRMVSVNKGSWDRSGGVDADHEFNKRWLSLCHRILKPAGTIWVSGTVHLYPSIGLAMRQVGFRILNDIVWQKPNPPPNLGCRCFTHSTEIVLWATKAPKGSRDKHIFHYPEMKAENGGRQMSNVWVLTAPGRQEKMYGKHPTQKPVSLVTRCLRASTNPGDLVVDPFLGSGTTAVAAARLDRRFIGIEAEPKYVELAKRRLGGIINLAR
jgi:site-specific DNA-methyltransferase (adenine-specific)